MIDIILWAPDRPTLRQFVINRGLLVDDGEGGFKRRDGFVDSWWAGTGNFMTAKGVYDNDGNEITPPTFSPGQVALLRVYGSYFSDDVIVPDDADPDKEEQWARSKIAQAIKNNGTPGSIQGGEITYYEWDGVRIFRAADVMTWLVANDLPGHEFMGGNRY